VAKIFHTRELKFQSRNVSSSDFEWQTSERLSELAGAKKMIFDIRSLTPDKFSFPYHYHRNAEELFYIISGECSLRTSDGITRVRPGDLIHFASSSSGSHQLYNDTTEPCIYLDIRTFDGIDIVDYPDSGKIGIAPERQFYYNKPVDYFEGEQDVRDRWKGLPTATDEDSQK
jgi:uncharacterized cupin superfamily protein